MIETVWNKHLHKHRILKSNQIKATLETKVISSRLSNCLRNTTHLHRRIRTFQVWLLRKEYFIAKCHRNKIYRILRFWLTKIQPYYELRQESRSPLVDRLKKAKFWWKYRLHKGLGRTRCHPRMWIGWCNRILWIFCNQRKMLHKASSDHSKATLENKGCRRSPSILPLWCDLQVQAYWAAISNLR